MVWNARVNWLTTNISGTYCSLAQNILQWCECLYLCRGKPFFTELQEEDCVREFSAVMLRCHTNVPFHFRWRIIHHRTQDSLLSGKIYGENLGFSSELRAEACFAVYLYTGSWGESARDICVIVRRCLNPLKTKRRLLYLKTQFVPRSKRF